VKIVIAGHGKSGTTALFYAIKSALPPDTRCLFEPRSFEPHDAAYVLAKVLINVRNPVDFASFEGFDRKILVVRDPRDVAVSRTPYAIYNVDPVPDDAQAARFIGLLERKEADPTSVSLLDLWNVMSDLLKTDFRQWFAANQQALLEFRRAHPDYFVFRYEDLVAGELAPLEHHLGLQLPKTVSVDPAHRRVERAKSSGDWRHWLTPADVAWLEPICREPVRQFGYSESWALESTPVIDPEHASQYVRRLIDERRSLH
jgi:hypothetical protein